MDVALIRPQSRVRFSGRGTKDASTDVQLELIPLGVAARLAVPGVFDSLGVHHASVIQLD